MNFDRVVQLHFIAGENEGDRSLGSGYRISTRHILTAKHVVGDAQIDNNCTISILPAETSKVLGPASTVVSGRVAWISRREDLALIKIDEAYLSLVSTLDQASFCVLPFSTLSWPCRAIGFPGASGDVDTQIDAVACFVGRGGYLDVNVSKEPRDWKEWAGFSGSALCINDEIIGVIRTVESNWHEKLAATPASRLLEDEDFLNYWSASNEEDLIVRQERSASLSTSAMLTLSIRGKVGRDGEIRRRDLQDLIRRSQDLSSFPEDGLNIYPTNTNNACIWNNLKRYGWRFSVSTTEDIIFQRSIAERATFFDNSSGEEGRTWKVPGVSAFEILKSIIGILYFYKNLLEIHSRVDMPVIELDLSIDRVLGRTLSFDGFDWHLSKSYPDRWHFIFWNFDAEKCSIDQVIQAARLPKLLTDTEIALIATELFSDVAFVFNFRTDEYSSHSFDKIKELAVEITSRYS